MDGTVWFFLILGLGLLLAICISLILCVYLCQRRKRNKVDVAHSCTDTSSRSSVDTKTPTKNGQIHVFHGLPNEGKSFHAPPPPSISPEIELETYNKQQKKATKTSVKNAKSSGKRDSNAIVLEIDDEGNYNPHLPQGIEIGKFRRQSASSGNYETRLELDGEDIEIVDSNSVHSKASPVHHGTTLANDSFSKKRSYVNATTNKPFHIDLPDSVNNMSHFKKERPQHFAPISARAFPHVLEKLTENENEQLYAEFERLEKVRIPMASIASTAANIRRNRFYDILPYEFNRIILLSRGGRKPDYINASYIEDINGKNNYIAAMGPIGGDECVNGRRDETVSDFWRMIWQENVDCIVMLTQCVEGLKTKCGSYWPQNPGENMQVDDDLNVNFYCIVEDEHSFQREFILSNTTFTQDKPRKVLQWHFKQWSDSSSPENAGHLLHFIRQVRASTHSNPIVVHCSAGVGRSGVFIALDQLLDKLEADEPMDIFGTVTHLRHQRPFMVQNAEQYCTIYDVMSLAVKQKLGQEDKDDLTSLDRNRWLSTVSLNKPTS